jgi:DNA-binding response OmpR family regulator
VQRKCCIVVVEPDDLLLGLLERWLTEAGYAVVIAAPQKLPESVMQGEEPDLVIIDIPTPGSAEKIIEAVRNVYAGPILLLSARFRRGTNSSSLNLAHRLGVTKVLPIPFTREELLAEVAASLTDEA